MVFLRLFFIFVNECFERMCKQYWAVAVLVVFGISDECKFRKEDRKKEVERERALAYRHCQYYIFKYLGARTCLFLFSYFSFFCAMKWIECHIYFYYIRLCIHIIGHIYMGRKSCRRWIFLLFVFHFIIMSAMFLLLFSCTLLIT